MSDQESEQKTTKREATTVKIKPELWKDVKIEAIKEGKTASQLLEEALEAWIKEHRKK